MNPAHPKLALNGMTPGESFLLKWQYRWFDAGDFAEAFVRAASLADDKNAARLAAGFPEEMAALKRFYTEDGYWLKIQAKAQDAGLPVTPGG